MPASSRRSTRLLCLAVALVAGVALTSCSRDEAGTASGARQARATNTVEIKNFKFAPQTITVKAGTVVTWTNTDDTGHTATATDQSFDSKLFGRGESYSFTFTKPGTFDYRCTPHQYMTGTVIVT